MSCTNLKNGFTLSAPRAVSLLMAVEFVNEPNMLKNIGFPKDYTATDFYIYDLSELLCL